MQLKRAEIPEDSLLEPPFGVIWFSEMPAGPAPTVSAAPRKPDDPALRANRLNTLGWLAASIIHEIAQPLMGLIASADASQRWLLAEPADIVEARAAAASVAEQARKVGELVSSIRAMVMLDQGACQRLHPNQLVLEVCRLLREEFSLRGLSVALELGADAPFITGDSVQINQVLLNLLINAMEAMDQVRGAPPHILIRTSRNEQDRAVISVWDSGSGVDPAIEAQIFDPFFTSKAAGSGAGLAIARSIVDRHGGRLSMHRPEGGGSRFEFDLPADKGRT